MLLITNISCLEFSVSVILFTVVWLYIGRKWQFSVLALVMYLPGLMAFLFVNDVWSFIVRCLGCSQVTHSLVYSLLAIVFAVVIVAACAALDLATGWAKKTRKAYVQIAEHKHSESVWGFVRVAGEEIGWRCFLLPCLMSSYSPFVALSLSGVVWALFHVPVMVVLSLRLKPSKPFLTILVQCVAVFLAAFGHGWLAIQSGYSLWPSTMMHFVWNKVNPIVLGSIYMQTAGWLVGPQWLINGEGFAGCVVMLPVAAICVLTL